MDEWSESVFIALSIIIMAAVILFTINTVNMGKRVMDTLNEQQAVSESIKEFRLYNAYDNKTVYCQDVVSLILETRGVPYVHVQDGTNNYYWQESAAIATTLGIPVQHSSVYSSTAILDVLDINKVYRAELVKGGNGELVGIKLIAVTI